MIIGGLDIGSGGAKLTIMSHTGGVLHRGYYEYPVVRNVSAHEIHADDIWNVVKRLLMEAVHTGFSAIGVTSFGESFVLLDEAGNVLLPTMLYTDPRGGEETDELCRIAGRDRICAVAGCAPHSMYSLPKLMWVRKHRPDVYAKVSKVCMIADFIVYRMTGRHLIDYSLAARTLAFDIRKKQWDSTIFNAAEIDMELFGVTVPTGTDAGRILPALAAELGLKSEVHAVLCCQDQVAAAVGANVMESEQATNGTGTVECITPVFTGVPDDRKLQDNNYAIVPFLNDSLYCLYAFSYTGGALTKWFADTLAGYSKYAADKNDVSVYEQLESGMRDEPTGILVLPHFAGAATPYMDTGAKGAVVGLELSHSESDLYRAFMEGIVYEMRLNLEKLAESGIRPQALHATGGCAKSRLWLQMRADILDLPIHRMSVDEAGTVGGIMLTGVAMGVFDTLRDAAQVFVRPLETFSPRPHAHNDYMPHYERYKQLYNAVRKIM